MAEDTPSRKLLRLSVKHLKVSVSRLGTICPSSANPSLVKHELKNEFPTCCKGLKPQVGILVVILLP